MLAKRKIKKAWLPSGTAVIPDTTLPCLQLPKLWIPWQIPWNKLLAARISQSPHHQPVSPASASTSARQLKDFIIMALCGAHSTRQNNCLT